MHRLKDTQEFFNDVAPRWILDTAARTERLKEIFDRYRLPLDGPILDVGGGAGIMLPLLRGYSGANTPIIELEVAADMLRMGRQLHALLRGIDYVRADGQRLPFASGSLGSIHCFSVYPHFHRPADALAEFRRCLRPGGALCILHLMGHEQLNALHRDAGSVVERDVLPPVGILAETLAAAGFRVSQMEERPDLYILTAVRD